MSTDTPKNREPWARVKPRRVGSTAKTKFVVEVKQADGKWRIGYAAANGDRPRQQLVYDLRKPAEACAEYLNAQPRPH